MLRQIASYIDALIPGLFGLLLLVAPQLFTKAQGDALAKTTKKLRIIGALLLAVAAVAVVTNLSSNP